SLELVQVGGARFDPALAARAADGFGAQLQQVFGMAEGLVNYTRLDDPRELVTGTQGRPISPDDEIRIVDDDDRPVAPGEVGHLLTRGPYTIRGYYEAHAHNARAFTADGFYRTGDRVRVTATGHLIVEGRAKDQVNRGGEKIPAEEIEHLLLAHPGVVDAALVPMPDPYLGERSCAYVIRGTPAPGAAELIRFVREQGVAAFKVPDRIEFVDVFPKTPVGKIDKRALRERIASQLSAAA
ncbi:AMP-binding protein, partial [Burkholderia ubonensis]